MSAGKVMSGPDRLPAAEVHTPGAAGLLPGVPDVGEDGNGNGNVATPGLALSRRSTPRA